MRVISFLTLLILSSCTNQLQEKKYITNAFPAKYWKKWRSDSLGCQDIREDFIIKFSFREDTKPLIGAEKRIVLKYLGKPNKEGYDGSLKYFIKSPKCSGSRGEYSLWIQFKNNKVSNCFYTVH